VVRAGNGDGAFLLSYADGQEVVGLGGIGLGGDCWRHGGEEKGVGAHRGLLGDRGLLRGAVRLRGVSVFTSLRILTLSTQKAAGGNCKQFGYHTMLETCTSTSN
jgi:hypothetical protein